MMKTSANRVLLAFKAWDGRKKELEPLLKTGAADTHILARLQLAHLRQANHRLQDSARMDEQPFMALLKSQIGKLEKQLYPNLLLRAFSKLKDRYFDRPAYLKQQQRQRLANLENLKSLLRDKGLGSIAGKLEQHLDADQKDVCLPLDCQLGAGKHLNFDLHFAKDVNGDFQLHRLDGKLLQDAKIIRSHQFEISNWPGLKANQAWSLLEGRALKQHFTDASGHESQRWVELGANGAQHYHPEYPFDIKTALAAMPAIIRNKDELIRCLENGQQVATHWKQDGQFQSIYVQADPADRALKLFDAQQKPVTAEQLIQKARRQAADKKQEVSVRNARKRVKNDLSL